MGNAARAAVLAAAVAFVLATASSFAAGWVRKTAGTDWTWFEDYAFAWATYVVACEPDRRCQVGMGIFSFGAPRGEKISFTGERDILVVGFGSLHIRSVDGKGTVKAAIAPKEAGLLKATWEF